MIVDHLFGWDLDWWEQAAFELGWRDSNGSGLGRSLTEVLAMPIDHIERDLERIGKRRREQAKAIKSANKTGKR